MSPKAFAIVTFPRSPGVRVARQPTEDEKSLSVRYLSGLWCCEPDNTHGARALSKYNSANSHLVEPLTHERTYITHLAQ